MEILHAVEFVNAIITIAVAFIAITGIIMALGDKYKSFANSWEYWFGMLSIILGAAAAVIARNWFKLESVDDFNNSQRLLLA